jgi:hypothetical protein
LKQKEKSEPIQTNDLTFISEVGGVYRKPFLAAPEYDEHRVFGLPEPQPKGLAEANQGV